LLLLFVFVERPSAYSLAGFTRTAAPPPPFGDCEAS